jgi:hypothetical protein
MKRIMLLGSIIISGMLQAQCVFSDDYGVSSLWTQVGTDVQVSNNKVEFLNGAIDGESSGGEGQK